MIQLSFNKSAAQFILDAFPDVEKKCDLCGCEINSENLGGVIHSLGFLFKNIGCCIEMAELIELYRK